MSKLILVIFMTLFFDFNRSVSLNTDEGELLAAAVISRHGDRSPFSSFPTDKYYNLTYWPMGFGQLTTRGIDRHYKLGQWIRRHYDGFLSEYYHSNDIYACSTDVDRTLMSTSANLAGIYPPKGFQRWNEHIPWQPVPTHIAHFVSLIETIGCPKYNTMLNKLKEQIFPRYEEKYADIFKYIAKHTGWKKVTVDMVDNLMDLIFTYQQHDTSYIPDWSKKMDHNVTRYLSAVVYELPTHTLPLARLRIGTFYDYLFSFFDKFINGTSSNVRRKSKFLLLVAHESTLTAILNTIGAYKMKHVEYGDAIIWELRKRKNGTHFVNVLYKHNDELNRINVFKCDFNCNYDRLKQTMSNVTVTVQTWYKECVE